MSAWCLNLCCASSFYTGGRGAVGSRSKQMSQRGNEAIAPGRNFFLPLPPPPFLAIRHFSGEGGEGVYLRPHAAGILYAPPFYTPPTPRRVFSGVGGVYKIGQRRNLLVRGCTQGLPNEAGSRGTSSAWGQKSRIAHPIATRRSLAQCRRSTHSFAADAAILPLAICFNSFPSTGDIAWRVLLWCSSGKLCAGLEQLPPAEHSL